MLYIFCKNFQNKPLIVICYHKHREIEDYISVNNLKNFLKNF